MLFAATYPERTEALLLIGAEVKEETTEDWPWGEETRAEFDAVQKAMEASARNDMQHQVDIAQRDDLGGARAVRVLRQPGAHRRVRRSRAG